ncbi:MAG: flagellar biosynthesis protein FlhA [Burkholderiales bacterium]|nr:flagellar biosynthesis protein FlhA [Burkholderiales bacterium]
MNDTFNLKLFLGNIGLRAAAMPMLIIMILTMMILPVPPFLLDLLFTFNIALAIIVLLVSLYTLKPLDFAAFPTVLLMTTLLRLSLNVASTRVVLLNGHSGADAAGKVIEAFGQFLVGGNYAVGLVVFFILVVINFVVITKGAGRIAEVSARFTLDAMPGKQMAIDADLNAGLIGEEDARRRRREISQEAEFYGAMDGASKFVRGDAVAGIIILMVNVIGGLVVGVMQHDLDVGHAAKIYTLLTIGDGLVAQIPALVISTAAGIVVSRVGSDQSIGDQLISQLFNKSQVLMITAGILGIMGMIPGMPNFAFLLLAALLGGGGYMIAKRPTVVEAPAPEPAEASPSLDASWNDVVPVDTLGLEVGYRLIALVDKAQDGELLKRIKGLRKKFALDVGFLAPAVHIRDNLELRPNAYVITLKGVEIGRGESYTGMYLAINPGHVSNALPGAVTHDPAFGLPAVWVDAGMREQAQTFGYTVVDAGTVIATHLNHVMQTHAAELLGRQETQQLLDHVGRESPKLIEDLVPKLLPLGTVQKVLQRLLEEGVHIRDMRTIIEVLAEHGAKVQDAGDLSALVRVALGRAIVQQLYPGGHELQVMALEPNLERVLLQAVQSKSGEAAGIEPGLVDTLLREAGAAAQQQERLGLPPVLLVPAELRVLLARFLRRAVSQIKVIAHSEIPDTSTIKVTALLGGKG